MNNKEAIIQKIIDDANAIADKNISEANAMASQTLERANKEIEAYKAENADKAKKLYDETLARTQVVSNLDCKKLLLNAKKAIIDKAFENAIVDIKKDKKGYLALVESMITNCCEDKDEVIICEQDAKVITKKFIGDLSKKLGKELVLGKEYGDFAGGVILVGKNYDKNLTLDLEMSSIRQELEGKISEILFGSKK